MIGIYLVRNQINEKVYVGQSWDIDRRWYEEKKTLCNAHLKASMIKYGIDKFEFSILEILDSPSQEELTLREAFYILFRKKTSKSSVSRMNCDQSNDLP